MKKTPLISKFFWALMFGALLYFIFNGLKIKLYAFYLENKYPLNYKELVVKYSEEYSLEPSLVAGVIYEESRFRPNAQSEKGAIGLMQLLPETAEYIASKTQDLGFDGEDLSSVELNIKYGCYYLSYLYDRYGDWDKVLVAYNAGEGNLDMWLTEGEYEIKFEETRNFVERVKESQEMYDKLYFGK